MSRFSDSKSETTVARSFKEDNAESVEFAGMAVAHLAADDPGQVLASKSGRTLLVGDLAHEYGFVDLDGKVTLLGNYKCLLIFLLALIAIFHSSGARLPLTPKHSDCGRKILPGQMDPGLDQDPPLDHLPKGVQVLREAELLIYRPFVL